MKSGAKYIPEHCVIYQEKDKIIPSEEGRRIIIGSASIRYECWRRIKMTDSNTFVDQMTNNCCKTMGKNT